MALSEELAAQIEADANVVPDDNVLRKVSSLVESSVNIDESIKRMEETVKQLKDQLLKLQREAIPTVMDEVGLSSIITNTGFKVEVKPFVSATLTKEKKDYAIDWLEDNDHDGIVKRQLVVTLPKGAETISTDLYVLLHKELVALTQKGVIKAVDWTVTEERDIHYQTLNKWAREMMEDPELAAEFTEDVRKLFSLYVGRTTKITKV